MSAPASAIGTAEALDPGAGSDFWRRFRQSRNARLGSVLVGLVLLAAAVGPWLAPYRFDDTDLLAVWAEPSRAHLLGGDALGRDVLSRLVVGARISLLVAVSVLALTLTVGTAAGMAAGYFGGWVDTLLMRGADIVFAFPELILAIILVAALGPSLLTATLAIAVVYVPRFARVARTATLTVANRPYIDAARLASIGHTRIIFRHVLPNIRTPMIVMTALSMSTAQLAYAALSYLGFGARPPAADFGAMLADAQKFVTFASWLVIFPGLALVGIVVALNLCGDAVRDALDPHFERRS